VSGLQGWAGTSTCCHFISCVNVLSLRYRWRQICPCSRGFNASRLRELANEWKCQNRNIPNYYLPSATYYLLPLSTSTSWNRNGTNCYYLYYLLSAACYLPPTTYICHPPTAYEQVSATSKSCKSQVSPVESCSSLLHASYSQLAWLPSAR
jgi:hypothetical protein